MEREKEEKIKREKFEKERKEKEKMEQKRLEMERLENEKEKLEKEKIEREKLKKEIKERKDIDLFGKEISIIKENDYKNKNKYLEAQKIKGKSKDNLSKETNNLYSEYNNYKLNQFKTNNKNKIIFLPNYNEEKKEGEKLIKVKRFLISNSSENIRNEFPKKIQKEINKEEVGEKPSFNSLRFSTNKSKLTESSTAYFINQKKEEETGNKKIYWNNLKTPNEQKSDIKNEESLIKNKLIIDRMKKEKLKFSEIKDLNSETLKTKNFKKEEIKKDLFDKEENQKNIINKEFTFEVPKKSKINLEEQNKEVQETEKEKGKYNLKLSKKTDENLILKHQTSGEIEQKKKDKFKIFKKDDINKITSKHKKSKKFLEKPEKEKSEKELSSKFSKKKRESKEVDKYNESNESELDSKKFYKKNLNIQTKEELNENVKQKLKESIFNNNRELKIKGYKDKMTNLSEEKDQYINKEKNLDDLSISKNGLSTKLRIYRCVVWKNTDPDMNEDILETINHYRNRSQKGNKNFINKLPQRLHFQGYFSANNIFEQIKTEENHIENESNNNNFKKFRLTNAKSYANLY